MTTIELCVESRTVRYTDRTRGYMPSPAERRTQSLIEVTRRADGKILDRRVLDTEIVPNDVSISVGCFGDTGGWMSKFAPHIDAEKARKRARAADPVEQTLSRTTLRLGTNAHHVILRGWFATATKVAILGVIALPILMFLAHNQ